MWIISINGEDPVTSQGALNKLQRHQNQLGKTNLKVSIFIRKSYKRKNIEDIRSIFDQVRPVVSHLEVIQPWKPLTPNNIVEAIKDPKREYWKEALFVQYEKNKNFSLILYPIPITSPPPPDGTNVLCSLIDPSIKEGYCYDAWKFVTRHVENGNYQIKGVDFDQSYSPVVHTDPFRINIAIAAMNRLTDRILGVSNAFQNTNVTIHEKVCDNPQLYYLDWFGKNYPNVPLNRYDIPFCLQFMNITQGTK